MHNLSSKVLNFVTDFFPLQAFYSLPQKHVTDFFPLQAFYSLPQKHVNLFGPRYGITEAKKSSEGT